MNNEQRQTYIIENSTLVMDNHYENTQPRGSFIGSVYSQLGGQECIIYDDNDMMLDAFTVDNEDIDIMILSNSNLMLRKTG